MESRSAVVQLCALTLRVRFRTPGSTSSSFPRSRFFASFLSFLSPEFRLHHTSEDFETTDYFQPRAPNGHLTDLAHLACYLSLLRRPPSSISTETLPMQQVRKQQYRRPPTDSALYRCGTIPGNHFLFARFFYLRIFGCSSCALFFLCLLATVQKRPSHRQRVSSLPPLQASHPLPPLFLLLLHRLPNSTLALSLSTTYFPTRTTRRTT